MSADISQERRARSEFRLEALLDSLAAILAHSRIWRTSDPVSGVSAASDSAWRPFDLMITDLIGSSRLPFLWCWWR
ncbi:hypothetical protein [Micromonospora sp. CA-111912]|uniref:hypothetical protein n=1 Tax=Micromonospora sp. CA-111912 TaxID=3239955 RepID=UPI003D903F13